MKVSRYVLRGRIQRKGMAATSWVRCVVTASSRIVAQAAKAVQRIRSPNVGPASRPVVSAVGRTPLSTRALLVADQAATAHKTANTPYPVDQIAACVRTARFGSTSTG